MARAHVTDPLENIHPMASCNNSLPRSGATSRANMP
ncbi:hypothetical protein F441_12064 [Phytophthora nicotianae CJ01A1]|uniref:Uncharacterized protein n=6 Tax=Phytophthora nicotianae TaxID=4792 RepID=W2PZN3_PHYN3|nr:hypothetical protein PPTG_23366 [Phytophthora nicotianae INRA-310]ETI42844.1 hypothetical protein F443_12099 [Phytophthora nicotianae P1569]ETK82883.1 hypothetical protein L915_11813 [Phytophthora nicotianae]ETO71474.1 hypothetical protein F444_12205 [Phytophthora nicotianae P1976]ETP12600.1 hypothetical protein F441_12064 [Phytophthora nicotianae CJ01A1]ETP40696.1 hypothetical protein F442_12017 [Phytophthora nicotianae P10297]